MCLLSEYQTSLSHQTLSHTCWMQFLTSSLLHKFWFFNSPNSDIWQIRQFRESEQKYVDEMTLVPPLCCGLTESFLASGRHTIRAHAAHRQGAVSVSPGEICQNNHCLQNKSVILMDNSGKNKHRWLLFWEIFIAGAAWAVSSAVLHDGFSQFPHLSALQSVKETAAVLCISTSACFPMRPYACLSCY